MRLFILFFLLSLTPLLLKAQIQDDFSDGDFTANPTWSGDDTQFNINSSKKLQLSSTGSDTSFLSTPNALINNTEWRFYIKQSFNSSSNNHSRIYLISNQSDLKNTLNGYFIQFGSAQDDICLYRQDGNSITKIISGISGNTGNSVNEYTLKVIRDAAGNWELFSDASAGNNFQSEGTAVDLTYTTGSYFGLWCKYTSSNSTKVYFDDVYVGGILVDTIPPKLLSITLLDQHHIDLYFNEILDPISANKNTNYTSNNGLGVASNALLDATNNSLVHLSFWDPFVQGQINTLTVTNITDLKGNVAISQQLDFVWYETQAFDVVFNEIMADPSPKVGLPEWEYIELYNRTQLPLSLNNWTLQIGNTIKTLPDSTIAPQSYVIIAHQNASNELGAYGPFIGLGSFSLTNSKQQLILKNEIGNLIHQIYYTDSWYRDNNKSDGGWSMEQIDPSNPCGCEQNWKASNDTKGGSPGKLNAVNQANPDKTAPDVDRIAVVDSVTVRVYFTEIMDSSTILDNNLYSIDNYVNPIQVIGSFPDYRSVYLTFAEAFKTRKTYHLKLRSNNPGNAFADCVGNSIIGITYSTFGIPEPPDSNDVVINEILFNPQAPGTDYVELINRSDKVLDLKDLRLSNWNDDIQNYEHVKVLSEDGFLFFPNTMLVISNNSTVIQKQYFVYHPKWLIQIPTMISMSNTAGNVVVLSSSLNMIDRFDYDEEMHYGLIQDPKGISLERINYDRPTQNKDNWHSAAISRMSRQYHYAGTPTYYNTQYNNDTLFNGEFALNKDIFSPDNDGYDDVLMINYKYSTSGNTANIRIYNSKGQLVRDLLSNELLSTKGYFAWDGLNNNRQKANIGIYIIYIEVFNLNGDVKHYKLKTVLAGRIY